MTAVSESLKAGPSLYDVFFQFNQISPKNLFQGTKYLVVGHGEDMTFPCSSGKAYHIHNLFVDGGEILFKSDNPDALHKPIVECDNMYIIDGEVAFHQIEVVASRVVLLTKKQFSDALKTLKDIPPALLPKKRQARFLPSPLSGTLRLTSDVNAQQLNGHTNLTFSILMNDWDVVQLLIAARADLEQPAFLGQEPLRIAAADGCLEITKALVDARANLESTDHLQNTILLTAVSCNRTDIVECLLREKAIPHATNSLHQSALSIAAETGGADIINLLFAEGVDLRSHTTSKDTLSAELIHAVRTGDLEKVKELIPAKYDVDATNYCWDTPLTLAVNYSHTHLIEYLLSQKASTKDGLHNALFLAAQQGNSKIVKQIAQSDIDVAADFLISAMTFNKSLIVENLLQIDNNHNANLISHAALANAAMQHKSGVIRELLQTGVEATTPIESLLEQNATQAADFLLTEAILFKPVGKYDALAKKMGGFETTEELTQLLTQPKAPTHVRRSSLKDASIAIPKSVQWITNLPRPHSPNFELLACAKNIPDVCSALTEITTHLIKIKRGFHPSEAKDFLEALRNNPAIQSDMDNPHLLAILANHRRVHKNLQEKII